MSHEKRLAILDTLMALAWADGSYEEREQKLVGGILESMGAAPGTTTPPVDERTARRPLAEVLDPDDREYLYQQACRLSLVDGVVSGRELQLISALRSGLELSPETAEALESSAWELSK